MSGSWERWTTRPLDLDDVRDFWLDPTLWPRAEKQFTFILDVAQQLGPLIEAEWSPPDAWTSGHPSRLRLSSPKQSIVSHLGSILEAGGAPGKTGREVDQEVARAAYKAANRNLAVFQGIAEVFRNGELTTYLRKELGGPVELSWLPGLWNAEQSFYERFEFGQIDLAHPYDQRTRLGRGGVSFGQLGEEFWWVFVPAREVLRVRRRLTQSSAGMARRLRESQFRRRLHESARNFPDERGQKSLWQLNAEKMGLTKASFSQIWRQETEGTAWSKPGAPRKRQ